MKPRYKLIKTSRYIKPNPNKRSTSPTFRYSFDNDIIAVDYLYVTMVLQVVK